MQHRSHLAQLSTSDSAPRRERRNCLTGSSLGLEQSPKITRRSRRNAVRLAAVALPILLAPFVLESHATAGPSGSACEHGPITGMESLTTHDAAASVTIKLDETSCNSQIVSLVSYQTHGPDYVTAGAQTRFDLTTGTAGSSLKTLSVRVPNCFFQVDVIYGSDAPRTLKDQEIYFSRQGTLLASENAGTERCSAAPVSNPVVSATTAPTAVARPSGPVGIDLQSESKAPVTAPTQLPVQIGTTPAVPAVTAGTGVSPSESASVEAVSLTRAPTGSALPFTGLAISAAVLLGLSLVGAGTAVTVSLRRRLRGLHR
jgi:hypothetical protein